MSAPTLVNAGHYENFPVASIVLPRRLRRPVRAIYAFARAADDIADEGDLNPEQRLAGLDHFRDQLRRLETGEDVEDPLFVELGATIRTHALAWAVAESSVAEIDELNILQATLLAMRRAVAALRPAAEFALEAFNTHVVEVHQERSNALHARLHGVGSFVVGPLARWSLLAERIDGSAAALAREVGLPVPVRNPFDSIVVRAVEVLYAVEEACRIIDAWPDPGGPPCVPADAGPGLAYGASEAPRGLLVHRYRLDGAGDIVDASIVPPTSQNQAQIEADLTRLVGEHHDLDDATLTRRCETAIRNYDPCISCATHALRLTVDRG